MLLSDDEQQAGTSRTLTTASCPGVPPRVIPTTSQMSARVYPANRTRTAESNRLNDVLHDQVRTTVEMQNKLTAWLDINAVVASNERLLYHQ